MVKPWTVDELRRIAPLCQNASTWAPLLATTAQIYDILDTEHRLAMWTATIVHESNQLRDLEEDLNYTVLRLVQVWPGRFPSIEYARSFAFHPERLANRIYSARMGNGDEASGDGWKYRGRGLIQITGRAMYRACGTALQQPLLDQPELLLDREIAALSAAWYWADNGCNTLADRNNFIGVTERVNGGRNGLVDRQRYLETCQRILEQRATTSAS